MGVEVESDTARRTLLDMAGFLVRVGRRTAGRDWLRGYGEARRDSNTSKFDACGIPIYLIYKDPQEFFVKGPGWSVHVRERRTTSIKVSGDERAFDRDLTYLMMMGEPYGIESESEAEFG